MARVKIDYGIDLGTTNSAIARMEDGEVKIIKSDTQKDTTPSCVYFRKNAILVGDTAYGRYGDEHKDAFEQFSLSGKQLQEYNTFIEFKRTMGTDKAYESKNAGRSFNSEDLSAEILKALKNYVRDEDFSSVVITVPNRFRNNQIDATQKAAELAGFKYCELLMEPIAASIAYGVNARTVNGYWLVFDFGGGTFDVALMRGQEGIMQVVDTAGDNQLGGKELDYAVVDKIIIPFLQANYQVEKILGSNYGRQELRESLKIMAEDAKIAISKPSKISTAIYTTKPLGKDDSGKEIDFEINVSLADYELAVAPVFQRAIDICKTLIEKNNIKTTDLEMVLLVGGPTLSQTLRRMLKEQLKTKINTSIDPMTSVAVGAALFASSKDIPSFLQVRDKQKIQLTLQYPNSTVETEEEVGIKIDRNETEGEIPAKIFVEISRRDKGWSSGKVEMKTDTELIPVLLLNARSNGFEIRIFDEKGNPFSCEPLAFSIFQGFKEPPATLPMDLVIEVFITESNKRLLSGLPGLEKNKSLPARGKGTYKTQKEIRPGIADDVLKIPIYEGIPNTRAVHNELAGIVLITGDELPLFLPGGSDVEITLDVDKSRRIMVKTFFPDIDETIKRVIERTTQSEYDADEMDDEIEKALALLAKVEDESTDVNFIGKVKRLRTELEELKEILGNGRSDYNTKTKVMERLRLALIELDDLEIEAEFPRAVEILNTALHELWITDRRYGNIQTTKEVRLLEEQAVKFTREKNLKGIKDLTSQVSSLDFAILFEKEETAIYMSFFKNYDDNFETYTWKNRVKARKFISDAKVIISVNPTKVKLRPIIAELLQLLPETERPKSDNDETFLTEFYNKQ